MKEFAERLAEMLNAMPRVPGDATSILGRQLPIWGTAPVVADAASTRTLLLVVEADKVPAG